MSRKYQNRYVTSIPFEYRVFSRIQELLPKGITIADEINEFLKKRMADLEKDNSTNITNKGPIRDYENSNIKSTTVIEQKVQQNLNIYESVNVIKEHVSKIDDLSTAWKITRQAKLIASLADTRAKFLKKSRCDGDKNGW